LKPDGPRTSKAHRDCVKIGAINDQPLWLLVSLLRRGLLQSRLGKNIPAARFLSPALPLQFLSVVFTNRSLCGGERLLVKIRAIEKYLSWGNSHVPSKGEDSTNSFVVLAWEK